MMDIDEVPMRGDDGEREDEGRRDAADEDDMDMQMQDRMGGGGGGNPAPSQAQSVYWYQRWLQSQFAPRSAQPSRVSMDDAEGEDFRDHDDNDFRREGGDTDHRSSRIREPNKRYQQDSTYDRTRDEDMTDEQPNKRRRVSFGDGASSMIFGGVPALTEMQQAVVEYTAPSTFTPLFYYLGFTPFAVTWVMVMYTSHFVQTLLTNFGPDTKNMRYTMSWNIPPLPHTLMDTYVWNHSMISCMVLYPIWFSTVNGGNAAYWLAVFFVMAQQQFYWQVSLKTHYCKNHQANVPKRLRSSMESYFFHCFLCYGFAAGMFSLAKIFEQPLLLYVGLVEFNLAPIYMLWDYLTRVKKFAIGVGGGSTETKGGNSKKKN